MLIIGLSGNCYANNSSDYQLIDARAKQQNISTLLTGIHFETNNPLEALLAFEQIKHVHTPTDFYNFGLNQGTLWLTAQLINPSNETIQRVINNQSTIVDRVDIYLLDSKQNIQLAEQGGRLRENTQHSIFIDRSPAFLLTLPPQSKYTLLIRMETRRDLQSHFKLRSPEVFYNDNQQKNLLFGVYFGCLLLVVLFNISRAIYMRHLESLTFSGFLLAGGCYSCIVYGFGRTYLWPGNIEFDLLLEHLTLIISNLIILSLITIYLTINRSNAVTHFTTNALIYTGFIIIAATPFLPIALSITIGTIYAFFCGNAFFIIALYLLRFDLNTKLFAMSWIFIFSFSTLNSFSIMGLIPSVAIVNNFYMLSSIVIALIYTLIIGFQFRNQQQQTASLTALNKTRNDFIARISHDIRAPANALLGVSQLLEKNGINQTQQREIAIINSSANRLIKLINNILDFAALEAKQLQLQASIFKFTTLTENLISQHPIVVKFSNKYIGKNLYCGDQRRIEQSLSNIIAYLYSCESDNQFLLSIADNDKSSNNSFLFTISSQAPLKNETFVVLKQNLLKKNSFSDNFDLIISRRLLRKLSSSITITQDNEHRLILIIDIPLESVSPIIETKSMNYQKNDPKILIIEDNPVNQLILTEQIKSIGYKTDIAGNGKQAKVLIEQHAYSLIISDYELPDTTGCQLYANIKQQLPSCVVIILSAHIDSEKRAKCTAQGVKYLFEKPFKLEQLKRILALHQLV